MIKSNPIPKAMALVLVSICGAFLLAKMDTRALVKLDSMSAIDYVQYQRSLHQHSYLFRCFVILLLGGFFVGTVDFIAYVIALPFKRLMLNPTPGPVTPPAAPPSQ
jgi:hypothetical protein